MPTAADLREALGGLATLAVVEIRPVFTGTADTVRDTLLDILPALVAGYGAAAATVAADWYDDLRDELGVTGLFRAIPAAPDLAGVDALARWGVSPLFDAEPDVEAAVQRVAGGVQRRLSDAARRTAAFSSTEDPRAKGWQRQTSGNGCSFCQLLASRGTVYSRETVDFASHDSCACVAVPAFEGAPLPVRPYTPSEREATDADRARVRDYLAEHDVG